MVRGNARPAFLAAASPSSEWSYQPPRYHYAVSRARFAHPAKLT